SPTYDDVQTGMVSTKWVRLTSQFTLTLPNGCTKLSSVKLYIASIEGSAATFASFDVDDFRLVDLSASGTGAGGAGSSIATAGAAGR
ncbi:MAG TPA: hypothetical protein VIV60_15600, partial [Polyangiaceae bacterium]